MKEKRAVSINSELHDKLLKWVSDNKTEVAGLITCGEEEGLIKLKDIIASDDFIETATSSECRVNGQKIADSIAELSEKEGPLVIIHTHPESKAVIKSRADERMIKSWHRWSKEKLNKEVILGIATKEKVGFWEIGDKTFNRLDVEKDGVKQETSASEKFFGSGITHRLSNMVLGLSVSLVAAMDVVQKLPDEMQGVREQFESLLPTIASYMAGDLHWVPAGMVATAIMMSIFAGAASSLMMPTNKSKYTTLDKLVYWAGKKDLTPSDKANEKGEEVKD